MGEKVIFFDIDGTLVDDDKVIPPSTIEALAALKDQKDIHIVIATGRAPFMFSTIAKELGISSYVSFNGSYVVFNGEVIYKNPLKKGNLMELEQLALQKGHPMVFLDHSTGRSNEDNHPHIMESIGTLKLPYPPKDLMFYHDREVYQALLFCEEKHDKHYHEVYSHFDYVRWHPLSTDVLPLGGSKARGIDEMLKRLNIARENTFAFGDGLNDIEMLDYVGTGIAMGNAVYEAKQVANFVTEEVSKDGIFLGLKEIGLIK